MELNILLYKGKEIVTVAKRKCEIYNRTPGFDAIF